MSAPINILQMTPELVAELQVIEAHKNSILYGFLLAHGIKGGSWEVSGSVLMRTDAIQKPEPVE